MMSIQRRTVLRATALAPLAVASGARAATTGLVLACDTTLGPAMTDAARVGLVYETDVRADARLAVLAPVADSAYPPIVYAAAVTRLAGRPNPAAFVTFLSSPEASALLARHGLEPA